MSILPSSRESLSLGMYLLQSDTAHRRKHISFCFCRSRASGQTRTDRVAEMFELRQGVCLLGCSFDRSQLSSNRLRRPGNVSTLPHKRHDWKAEKHDDFSDGVPTRCYQLYFYTCSHKPGLIPVLLARRKMRAAVAGVAVLRGISTHRSLLAIADRF